MRGCNSFLSFLGALGVFSTSLAMGQGGGFVPGDLYLYSPAIQGSSSVDGALVHIDLNAGTATVLVDTFTTLSAQGAVAFDPYRQRIVFCAGLHTVVESRHLWAVDASGVLTDLGFANSNFTSLAPTGDGRIYLRENVAAAPFGFVDALGQLHTLLDSSGAAPFALDGNPNSDVRGMIYDAATNSLLLASPNGNPCPSGVSNRINVRRVALSADGTQVLGPVDCAQFDVSSTGETPVGWSRGPGGQYVLCVDTNSSSSEPRMLLVDPVTLAITPYASNSDPFAAAISAGTYSSKLDKVILLNSGDDKLRAFGAGEAGPGTTIPLVGTISAPFSSAEVASLIEIEPSNCAGAFLTYGAGFPGSGGVVPTLLGDGCPQAGGSFQIRIEKVVGGASGVLFAGLSSSNLPLLGGKLLVFPILLQVNIAVGGAAGVAGAGSLVLPVVLDSNPALVGLSVYLQGVFSDPGAAKGAAFTQGLELEIG